MDESPEQVQNDQVARESSLDGLAQTDLGLQLLMASETGKTKLVRQLLGHGASADMTSDDGSTALMLACSKGHTDVVDLLLIHGANADLPDEEGTTALMMACSRSHTDVTKLLLKYGANADLLDADGTPALMVSCINGRLDEAGLLLKHDASVSISSSDGVTTLMIACQEVHIDVVKLLLVHDASVDMTGPEGVTVLMLACLEGHTDVAELLLNQGASVNTVETNASTLLMMACREGHSQIADVLLSNFASLLATNAFEETALVVAASAGHFDLSKSSSTRVLQFTSVQQIVKYHSQLPVAGNIVRNDLKCGNFLIGSDDHAKIIDFGLSCIPNVAEINIDAKHQGAVQWRSPEHLRGEKSTLASDVYSFGMCILEAGTKYPPWGSLGNASIRHQVLRKGNLRLRPDLLKDDDQWRLIEMMCAKDSSRRLRMLSVMEKLHEFAQQEISMVSRAQDIPYLKSIAVARCLHV